MPDRSRRVNSVSYMDMAGAGGVGRASGVEIVYAKERNKVGGRNRYEEMSSGRHGTC